MLGRGIRPPSSHARGARRFVSGLFRLVGLKRKTANGRVGGSLRGGFLRWRGRWDAGGYTGRVAAVAGWIGRKTGRNKKGGAGELRGSVVTIGAIGAPREKEINVFLLLQKGCLARRPRANRADRANRGLAERAVGTIGTIGTVGQGKAHFSALSPAPRIDEPVRGADVDEVALHVRREPVLRLKVLKRSGEWLAGREVAGLDEVYRVADGEREAAVCVLGAIPGAREVVSIASDWCGEVYHGVLRCSVGFIRGRDSSRLWPGKFLWFCHREQGAHPRR